LRYSCPEKTFKLASFTTKNLKNSYKLQHKRQLALRSREPEGNGANEHMSANKLGRALADCVWFRIRISLAQRIEESSHW
jgi:hypothetical protein